DGVARLVAQAVRSGAPLPADVAAKLQALPQVIVQPDSSGTKSSKQPANDGASKDADTSKTSDSTKQSDSSSDSSPSGDTSSKSSDSSSSSGSDSSSSGSS